MSPSIVAVFVGSAITMIFGIVGYLFKRDQKNQDDLIKELDSENKTLSGKVTTLESDIRLLISKLWSDEKLSKVITNAVNLAFSEWQLRMIKEGWFNLGKEKEPK